MCVFTPHLLARGIELHNATFGTKPKWLLIPNPSGFESRGQVAVASKPSPRPQWLLTQSGCGCRGSSNGFQAKPKATLAANPKWLWLPWKQQWLLWLLWLQYHEGHWKQQWLPWAAKCFADNVLGQNGYGQRVHRRAAQVATMVDPGLSKWGSLIGNGTSRC